MRVLYLTMNANRASTTVPTEGWIRLLKDQGLEPVLVSHELGAFHEWAVQQGIPAYHVEMPAPDKWRPWRFLRSLWHLRTIAKRHKVQLIHCNEQNIYPNGQFLGKLMRLPVVVSIHFTMGRSYCEWAFGGKRAPARIFFISPGNLDACRPGVEGVISEDRWRMLFNGLDLAHFTPCNERRSRFREQHGLDGKLALGVACALRERKQLEHLFELGSRNRDPRVRIVVAGGAVASEREYAEELMALGRKKLGERLVHVGHLDELRDFYNGLDLFINTSREEACSISVLESMACGCPIVGYPSKSVDGQILPGGGEILPQDDIDALAAAVDRWISDNSCVENGRRGARARVEEAFDIRKLSNQLWDEYVAVVAGNVA